ncbi:MAG: TIGR03000 domain-containing protein [Thermoguttaceae bacterium]|nr:TIGR03000 domain-containing protein [Thermoguttaceae bacterium]
MKKSYLWLIGVTIVALSALALSTSAVAFWPGHGVLVGNSGDCDACDGAAAGYGLGLPGPGFVLPGGGLANSNFGRRAIPAPVYFANTYPEYLYGSPNIYAGFDEYDTDVAFVSPVVSKTPFHYDYYNDQYNYSPYYGKRWDKNWYITDQIAYRADDGGSAGALGAEASYGDSSARPLSLTNEKAAEPAPTETPAVPTTESAPTPAADQHIVQTSYTVSPVDDAYRGRFIYNFESFCDDDPPCCLLRPVACLARFLFGAPCCRVCGGRGGYCCAAYSGHGGYGGFNCPAYRRGGCGKPFVDPYAAPYTVGAVNDCCGGIYVDSYAEGGVFVDSNACGCVGEGYVQSAEEAVTDESAETDANNGETVATEDENTEPQNAGKEPSSDEESNLIPRAEQPADPTPDADPSQPSVPTPDTEDENDFRGMFDPVSTRYESNEGETVGSIRMAVPENAVVIINGYRTKLSGTDRTFLAKNLVPGEVYSFEIKVLVEKDGDVYSGVKETELRAGENTLVAFRADDFRREGLTYASK